MEIALHVLKIAGIVLGVGLLVLLVCAIWLLSNPDHYR